MPGVTWTSNTLQQSDWAAEELHAEKLLNAGTQLDISQFNFSDSQVLTLVAGAVVAGSNKTLTLTKALSSDIPVGTILDFGSGEFFALTTKGSKGSTSLVGTLAADVEGGESTIWKGVSGQVLVPDGTLLGRTYTERANGDGFGPAVAASDDEIYLSAFQVERGEIDAGVTMLRYGTLIYENKLPDWETYDATTKAKVRSLYQCIISTSAD